MRDISHDRPSLASLLGFRAPYGSPEFACSLLPGVIQVPLERIAVGGRLRDLSGMVLSRSAVLAGWQRRQGVEVGLVQSDVGRGGVGGNLHFSFGADDRRGDRRAG